MTITRESLCNTAEKYNPEKLKLEEKYKRYQLLLLDMNYSFAKRGDKIARYTVYNEDAYYNVMSEDLVELLKVDGFKVYMSKGYIEKKKPFNFSWIFNRSLPKYEIEKRYYTEYIIEFCCEEKSND